MGYPLALLLAKTNTDGEQGKAGHATSEAGHLPWSFWRDPFGTHYDLGLVVPRERPCATSNHPRFVIRSAIPRHCYSCGSHWYSGAGFPEAQETLNCPVIQETQAYQTDLGHVCLHLTVLEDTQALIKSTEAHATGEPQCCVMACSLKGPVTREASYPLSGSPCSPTPEVLPALRRFTHSHSFTHSWELIHSQVFSLTSPDWDVSALRLHHNGGHGHGDRDGVKVGGMWSQREDGSLRRQGLPPLHGHTVESARKPHGAHNGLE